jgi:hypothetical protein
MTGLGLRLPFELPAIWVYLSGVGGSRHAWKLWDRDSRLAGDTGPTTARTRWGEAGKSASDRAEGVTG